MEPQGKRTYSMMGEGSTTPADYMDQIKLESMLYPSLAEDLIRSSLAKLDQDVTDIKCSLEKKKAKVTLVQIEQKLNAIMNLLRTPYGEPPRSKKSKDAAVQYGSKTAKDAVVQCGGESSGRISTNN